jgi:hypothetical protein
MYESIKESAKSYNEQQENRRNQLSFWHRIKSIEVVNILINVVNETNLNWKVTQPDGVPGAAVDLVFDDRESGHFYKNSNSLIKTTCKGGRLRFRQAYNGRIVAEFLSHYDEVFKIDQERKMIADHATSELNETRVLEIVDEFLKLMIAWEESFH